MIYIAEASGAIIQIRPHKEFVPAKGRSKLLSLKMLTHMDCDLDSTHENASNISSAIGIRNAYDFMVKRRDTTGDLAMERWNAAIRLANFASLESAPLCVSRVKNATSREVTLCIDFFNRCTSRLPCSWTSNRGTERCRRNNRIGYLQYRSFGAVCHFLLAVHACLASLRDQVMHVNTDTLWWVSSRVMHISLILCCNSSLQVFESENHATIHSDQTKEGLSLFGLSRLLNIPHSIWLCR